MPRSTPAIKPSLSLPKMLLYLYSLCCVCMISNYVFLTSSVLGNASVSRSVINQDRRSTDLFSRNLSIADDPTTEPRHVFGAPGKPSRGAGGRPKPNVDFTGPDYTSEPSSPSKPRSVDVTPEDYVTPDETGAPGNPGSPGNTPHTGNPFLNPGTPGTHGVPATPGKDDRFPRNPFFNPDDVNDQPTRYTNQPNNTPVLTTPIAPVNIGTDRLTADFHIPPKDATSADDIKLTKEQEDELKNTLCPISDAMPRNSKLRASCCIKTCMTRCSDYVENPVTGKWDCVDRATVSPSYMLSITEQSTLAHDCTHACLCMKPFQGFIDIHSKELDETFSDVWANYTEQQSTDLKSVSNSEVTLCAAFERNDGFRKQIEDLIQGDGESRMNIDRDDQIDLAALNERVGEIIDPNSALNNDSKDGDLIVARLRAMKKLNVLGASKQGCDAAAKICNFLSLYVPQLYEEEEIAEFTGDMDIDLSADKYCTSEVLEIITNYGCQ